MDRDLGPDELVHNLLAFHVKVRYQHGVVQPLGQEGGAGLHAGSKCRRAPRTLLLSEQGRDGLASVVL